MPDLLSFSKCWDSCDQVDADRSYLNPVEAFSRQTFVQSGFAGPQQGKNAMDPVLVYYTFSAGVLGMGVIAMVILWTLEHGH